ncbi:MAG: hypothetical protein Q6363_002765, partial [Candidatus Njordarchaeota archaeon]
STYSLIVFKDLEGISISASFGNTLNPSPATIFSLSLIFSSLLLIRVTLTTLGELMCFLRAISTWFIVLRPKPKS